MEERELVALIEGGFNDLAARIEQSRSENDTRFAQIDGRFTQIDGRFAQIDGRLDRIENEVHSAHILIEDVRGEIRQVAEGAQTVSEKLDRHIDDSNRQFAEVHALMRASRH